MNKSSDNITKRDNRKDKNKDSIMNSKGYNYDNSEDKLISKTPIKGKNSKKSLFSRKNKEEENKNESPRFGANNNNNNNYNSNYLHSNISKEIIESDEEDESEREKRKLHQMINLIQRQNDQKAYQMKGEKVIIKKFTKKSQTPDSKSIFRKPSLIPRMSRIKTDDIISEDASFWGSRVNLPTVPKKMSTNKDFLSKKGSIMAESFLDFEKGKQNQNNINNNNYDTILQNLKNLNSALEQNEENNAYVKFMRRKITPDKNIKKIKNKSDSDNNSESNDSNNSYNESQSSTIKVKRKKSKKSKKSKKDPIKNRIIDNLKKKNKTKVIKFDDTSESNSLNDKSETLNTKNINIEDDNSNSINKDFNRYKTETNNTKKNSNNSSSLKILSPSTTNGKQNETDTELSSMELKQKKINSNQNYLLKVKNDLKEKLINASPDLGEENVTKFNGNVIDIKYISLKNYEKTVKFLKSELTRKGVKFKKIGHNSYFCTKGIRQFYVDIVKIPKNLFYYRFYSKKKQINNFK